jgi:hypothetical protein
MSTNASLSHPAPLEDVLEERDQGSFIPVPDDLVKRVMEKAVQKKSAQESLEDLLEERDQGPFVPLPQDWRQQVMAKAREHVRRVRAVASHA